MHDSCVGCSEHFRNPKFMTPESHIKTQLSEKCTFIFKCYLSNKVRNVLVFFFFYKTTPLVENSTVSDVNYISLLFFLFAQLLTF